MLDMPPFDSKFLPLWGDPIVISIPHRKQHLPGLRFLPPTSSLSINGCSNLTCPTAAVPGSQWVTGDISTRVPRALKVRSSITSRALRKSAARSGCEGSTPKKLSQTSAMVFAPGLGPFHRPQDRKLKDSDETCTIIERSST